MRWDKNKSLLIFEIISEGFLFALLLVLLGSAVNERISVLGVNLHLIISKTVPDIAPEYVWIVISVLLVLLSYLIKNSLDSFKPRKVTR